VKKQKAAPNQSKKQQLGKENSDPNKPKPARARRGGRREPKTDKTKYKTELCKNWVEVGTCPYGPKCQFAHGTDEVHNKHPQNEKYKSKLCNQFHTAFHCPYGNRCLFRHEDRDLEEVLTFKWLLELQVFPERYLECISETEEDSSEDEEARLPIFKFISEAEEEQEPRIEEPLSPWTPDVIALGFPTKFPVFESQVSVCTRSTVSEEDDGSSDDSFKSVSPFSIDSKEIEEFFMKVATGDIY